MDSDFVDHPHVIQTIAACVDTIKIRVGVAEYVIVAEYCLDNYS